METISDRVAAIRECGQLRLAGTRLAPYNDAEDLVLHRKAVLPYHPNGMVFTAFDSDGTVIDAKTYYSVGGGFVVDESATGADRVIEDNRNLPYPFSTGAELLALCDKHHLCISHLMWENEKFWRNEGDTRAGLLHIWQAMQDCVHNGCRNEGILPGGLKLRRRAPKLYRRLTERSGVSFSDPLSILDWVTLYALAVNEENAAGGRVVTAPTNGAAGIVPAVLHYYTRFVPGADEEGVIRFLLM